MRPASRRAGHALGAVRYALYRALSRQSGDRSKPYEAASALTGAEKIADPLLLIHGMADDNVVFENSTAIIAKLQETKRPFEMMVYPGATHAVTGEGRQTHVWSTIERFLDRTVRREK
jgi:dipeptidyl-peptidase-4